MDAVVLAVTAAAVVDDDVDDEDGVAVVVTDCAAASSAAEVRPSFTVLSSVDDAVEAETNLTKMTCNKALSYVRKKIERICDAWDGLGDLFVLGDVGSIRWPTCS